MTHSTFLPGVIESDFLLPFFLSLWLLSVLDCDRETLFVAMPVSANVGPEEIGADLLNGELDMVNHS